ncbi:MAG TPA: SpoIID/LytB domain-containing protein [Longimicrobiales bacterium]|nr:SpoIID/LytB domain-containing protein [Longimicrobiales bacterium]
MRRVAGVGLLLLLSTGACSVAGPRAGGPGDAGVPGATGAEPAVRVGVVVDTPSLEVAGTAGLELVDADGTVRSRTGAGETRVASRVGDGVEIAGGGEALRTPGAVTLRPRGGGLVVVNGTSYRGAVLVRAAERGVTAVNLLDMETYLLGVVPLEIGKGRPPEEVEAVKAQAIAARTYALRHMGRRSSLGFDFYGSVMDQVYGGVDADDPVSARAVRETRGEILVHDGAPIEAYYHSTCGGRTAALEEVWPGEPRPYLKSVSDARPGGGFYCESSNRFRWTESWTRDALVATLERGLAAHVGRTVDPGRIRAMALTGRTQSGRAEALRIATDAGEFRVRGDSIRWVLRPAPNRILNSALIELHPEGDGDVTGLTIEGGGWGHGIGMCQIGAVGRARDGQSYREILLTYYPGSRIARLYR